MTIKRNNNFETSNILPKVLVLNPRSIYNKVDQFKCFVKEEDIDLCMMSESWERPGEPLDSVIKLNDFSIISNPFQRSSSVSGGRPAIIVNSSKYIVDNINQSLVTIPWGVEATWCLITPKNVTNSSVVRKIAVCSFYSKPGSRRKSLLLDHISEAYHLLSAKYNDGLFFLICGDKNELNVQQILSLGNNLKQCVQLPTRLNPPQVLDVIITDLQKYYQSPDVLDPLEVDSDKTGAPSDHLMVVMEPIGTQNDKKIRVKKKVEFRPLTDIGFQEMSVLLQSHDWGPTLDLESADCQMESFQNNLFKIFSQCFPLKSKIFLSESQEFYTDKLVNLKRKKKAEFKKHRRSEKYQSLHLTYKKELNKAKQDYYKKKIRILRTSNPRMWHRALKKVMKGGDTHETIEVESIKHLSDSEQVELIADKFAEVANMYEPLNRSKISIPEFNEKDIPVVSTSEVREIMENMDTNKSCRKTDVPAKIFKTFSKVLCVPLTEIINNCIRRGVWPDYLKHELVTPIPKVSQPKDINDLRNISGLMMVNKIIEKVTCKMIVNDMKEKMDPTQFGNKKGVSIDHYLVKMLDKIMCALDKNSRGEAVAVIATMLDWRQAFPRQCPTLAIESFIRNGVRPALIPILMSFFENRRMSVKWRDVMSVTKRMKGGGPQGSTKGVLSYMSMSNNNADCVPEEERFKYFDDATVLEIVNLLNIGMSSYRVRDTIPSHIPLHNQFIENYNLKSQKYLDTINNWTVENRMELNENKTKSLIFNFSKKHQFATNLELKQQRIEIVDQAKLLGLILTSDLKWESNTNYLVKDANKRMVMLRAASKFTRNKSVLKQIYYSRIRCKLEQSAAVWSSSLSQKNIEDLERVQKSAVRIIYGRNYDSYTETLKELNIMRLSERREIICLNFAKKSLKLKIFRNMFPLNSKEHIMKTRDNNIFKIKYGKSKRYKDSAIPAMQRLLNRDLREQKLVLKRLKNSVLSPTNYACTRFYC